MSGILKSEESTEVELQVANTALLHFSTIIRYEIYTLFRYFASGFGWTSAR